MRNQFQDIIPPDKRSIRNIPIPSRKSDSSTKIINVRKTKLPSEEVILKEEKSELAKFESKAKKEKPKETFHFKGKSPSGGASRFILWIITAVVVVALFLAITNIFRSADVYVTEKSESVALTGPETFFLEPVAGQAGYSAISLADSATVTLPASGEKQVSTKAAGIIVVYNNYSAASQKLVAGTRFETPSGLIFKLDQTVIVPGLSKKANKNVPGSVEASVTADKPGADYNIPLTDFTIPGFKGDPRYSAFYGRSKSAMSGGDVGTVATINDAELAKAVADLKAKLEASLREKAAKQLPSTQQTFDGFNRIAFVVSEPRLQLGSKEKQAIVKVEASEKVYALDMSSFAKKLLKEKGVEVASTTSFYIDFSGVKVSFEGESTGTLTANLEGKAVIIWNLNETAYKAAITGLSVAEAEALSHSYPEILKMSAVIKPFSVWHPSLPKSADDISIIIQR